ncbi:hypothetical protein JIG36_33550 [Actinoplanes sp. LDG1-06]|uniref:Uncharacterized protein n=1 Tax=Paractinoplanes ovalisporus TaxID=2810368 RepID=A0ABS2AKR8_9ACTN|nr:hypothetical protein [Actinoplanes ovalisporus]MBM2620447.1 hypothetical protein [Actinoplanes ovalisporus]
MTALGLSHWMEPRDAIIKAAVSGVVTAAWDSRTSRKRPGDIALLQHYLQFLPTNPSRSRA